MKQMPDSPATTSSSPRLWVVVVDMSPSQFKLVWYKAIDCRDRIAEEVSSPSGPNIAGMQTAGSSPSRIGIAITPDVDSNHSRYLCEIPLRRQTYCYIAKPRNLESFVRAPLSEDRPC